MRFPTGCRLLVLHWTLIIAFLIIAASYGLGLRIPGMATVAIAILLLALGLAVVASLFALTKRCSRCGECLSDQLPRQPLGGIDGLVLDKRSRAIVRIAIAGRYQCTRCGHWN